MTSSFNSMAFALSIIFILVGCTNQDGTIPMTKTTPVTTKYNDFVRGYTSGVISSEQGVEVQFIDFDGLNNISAKDMITFSPAIEGEAAWKGNRTLVFYPKEKWTSGQVYKASVDLNKIPALSDTEDEFEFSFEITKLTFYLDDVRLQHLSTSDLNVQNLTGAIQFSDAVEIDQLDKMLKISGTKSVPNVTWQYHIGENRHGFIVEQIVRDNEAYPIDVRVDGSKIGMDKSVVKTISVPPKGSFQYMSHAVYNGSNQHIAIYFSDPIKRNQELEGVVSFHTNLPVKYVVDDNQLRVYPSSRQIGEYVMTIHDHIKNIDGLKLNKSTNCDIKFFDEKPQVSLLKEGVIMPRSEGLKFPFKAVNVRAVRLKIVHILEDNVAFFLQRNQLDGNQEIKRAGRLVYNDVLHLKTESAVDLQSWNTYSFNLEQYVDVEPGAVYRVILELIRPYSLYPCAGDSTNNELVNSAEMWNKNINESDENYYNSYSPTYYYWDYDGERQLGDPCEEHYYNPYYTAVSQSIVASDLGLIAKRGENNIVHVAVSDIISSGPKSGIELRIYTYQHTLIGTGSSDKNGFAHIEVQGKPHLLVARDGADYGYLKLDDGTVESISMFEVEGQMNKERIKGLLYGERGVWRPGDSIFLQFVLQDKLEQLPPEHPIVMEWYNPRDQLIKTQVRTFNHQVIHDFRLKTNSADPTGNWKAVVKVGNNKFEKNIRVETVKPNRLKMDIDFGGEVVKINKGNISGQLSSKWLHGANASSLKADVKLKLKSGSTKFENYKGHRFDDATKGFRSSEKEIFSGLLNNEGVATITSKINTKNAPGMLSAQFTTSVYEQGGEFSIDRKSVQLSPFDKYVGIKIPKGSGWNGSIKASDEKIANIVLVDADGNPVSGEVEIKIYGLSWRWWYDRNNGRSLSNFMRSKDSEEVSSKVITVSNGQAFFDIPEIKYYSSYLIVAKNVEGNHSASHEFRLHWDRSDVNDKESSKMLQFSVVKDKFQIDESIEVNIPSNGHGHFIVSLENANDVVKLKRVKAEKDNTKVSFYADPSLIPNAYVYVAYIQPHAQTANDLPIRMYGVQPVFIEDQSTHINPEIAMLEKWEPEQEVEIVVSEKDGKAMEYTLAIVDEGLLQLTRFQTPDVWSSFHQKEALSVRTWDLYDEVIGAHSGEMAGLLAIGGDGHVIEVGGVKANRFPPMVRFEGPFKLNKNEEKTHKIKLPNYVGQVRVMIVAATDRAYGKAEKSIEVKKPLMVLASLPRVVGPGETLKLPVTTFAMEPNIKQVDLKVESGSLFNVSSGSKKINFSQVGDQVTYFPITVKKQIGQEKVKIVASGHGQQAVYEIDIDVRPSNPPMHSTKTIVLGPGESKSVDFKLPGVDGTNELAIEVANGLQIDLGEKANRLFGYPHGCIEQTTSRAFPQLYLPKIGEISKEKQAEIDKNIKGGIERLYSFQLRNGGLSYWPGRGHASPWGTTYAGHFMLEAKAMGYALPPGFLSNWINYQKQVANSWLPGKYGISDHGYRWSHELMQAYRLYTLALAEAPAIGAMNRLRNQENLSQQAKWRLALAYVVIGREEVAIDLIGNLNTEIKPYKNYGRTFGSQVRDQAMILETLIKMEKYDLAFKLAKKIAEGWQSAKWYSTQTSAYALMSLFKFLEAQKSANMKLDYNLNGDKYSVDQNAKFYVQDLDPPYGTDHTMELINRGENRLFVKINASGVPLEGNEEKEASNLVLKVKYTDMAGKTIDVNNLKRGTDFIASVTASNPGVLGHYKEMALTQIFPSGWEIHNTRLDALEDEEYTGMPEYQDIRDDRVYTYFDIPSGNSRTYKVKLTALFPGNFYQPAVFCEAMYDRDIYALEPGKWIQVVE